MNIFINFEAGGKVIFDGADYIFLEIAVYIGNDRMKVWDKNIDVVIFRMFVGKANHWQECAEVIA